MKTLIMTEMMQTTVKIQPNGRPIGPEEWHRMAFLAEKNQERAHARRQEWRTFRSKLGQILAGFHFNNRARKEIT
jgi:hypothetical protein